MKKMFVLSVVMLLIMMYSVSAYTFIDKTGREIMGITEVSTIKQIPSTAVAVIDTFEKANIQVTPAIAQGINNDYTQEVEICNRDKASEYYWIVPEYNELRSIELFEKVVTSIPIDEFSQACSMKVNVGSYYDEKLGKNISGEHEVEVCEPITRKVYRDQTSWKLFDENKVSTLINSGAVKIAYQTPFKLSPSECKTIKLHYITYNDEGKYNIIIYGGQQPDYCVSADSCDFKYVLDPWYTGTNFKTKRARTMNVELTPYNRTNHSMPVFVGGYGIGNSTNNMSHNNLQNTTWDYLFTNDTLGTVLLPYEIDFVNNLTGEFAAWVLQDVANSTTLDIGNDTTNTVNFANTTSLWNDYTFVWHATNQSESKTGIVGQPVGTDVYTLNNMTTWVDTGNKVWYGSSISNYQSDAVFHRKSIAFTPITYNYPTGNGSILWWGIGWGDNSGLRWDVSSIYAGGSDSGIYLGDDGVALGVGYYNGANCDIFCASPLSFGLSAGYNGVPHFYAVTWGNCTMSAYLDGLLIDDSWMPSNGQGCDVRYPINRSINIGSDSALNGYTTRVQTDEFRISNRSMNATEIMLLYQMGRGVYSNFSGSSPYLLTASQISVVKTAIPSPANASQTLLYQINITSTGTTDALNITVNETYPSGVILQSTEPASNFTIPLFFDSWLILNLSPAQVFSINITVMVENMTNGTIINNTLNVTWQNYSYNDEPSFVYRNDTFLPTTVNNPWLNITDCIGVYLFESAFNNITENNISVNGTQYCRGIQLVSTNNTNITGNNITTHGTLGGNIGVYALASSLYNIIQRNVILTNSSSASSNTGIYFLQSNNNNISDNKIVTDDTANSGGITIDLSSVNLVLNNYVETLGASNVFGITIVGNGYGWNNFTKNNITTNRVSGWAINITSNALMNEFVDTYMYNVSDWIYNDAKTNFTNTTFFDNNGSINYPDRLQINESAISRQKLNVSYNKAFVDSFNIPSLNFTGIISLFGLTPLNPVIQVQYIAGGPTVTCPTTQCRNLTALSGTDLVFNVTHWTTYTLGSKFVCGAGVTVFDDFELNETLDCSGNGLILAGGGLTINCNGNTIVWNADGVDDTDVGINLAASNNVRINNCVLIDNTSTGGYYGISGVGSLGMVVANTTIIANNSLATAGGIYAGANFVFVNDNINTFGVFAGNGIYARQASIGLVDNVTAYGYLAMFCEDSTDLNITNNNFNSTVFDAFEIGGGVSANCDRLNIKNNYLASNGTFASGGLGIYQTNYTNIINNTIVALVNSLSVDGIYISSLGKEINITNNTIIINGSTGTATGIRVESGHQNIIISNNSITMDTGAGLDNVGIRVNSIIFGVTSNLYGYQNRIENRIGTATNNYGISIEGVFAHDNIFFENSEIHMNNGAGINLDDDCTNCKFYDTTITNENGYGVEIAKSGNLFNMTNTSIRAGKWAYLNIGLGGIVGLTNVTFRHSSNAFIQYPLAIIDTVGIQDITQSVMNFTGEYAFMNASLAPDLNTTAIINLVPPPAAAYSIILADYGDTGTKQVCSDCNWLGYSAGLIGIFNVSHWTNYTLSAINAGECSIANNVLNASAIEYDNQSAIINMSHPIGTSVGGEFWYPITTNVSDNLTFVTTVLNATHYSTIMDAHYTTPIVYVNGTVYANNWHTYCYLPNGTIFNVTNTTNLAQTLAFAYGFANETWGNNLYEATNANYTINLSSYPQITYINLTIFLNGTPSSATRAFSAINAGQNYTVYNVSDRRIPLINVNNTNLSYYYYAVALYTNGTVKQFNTTPENQTVMFGLIPQIPTAPNVLETQIFAVNANLSKIVPSNVTLVQAIIEYNFTNGTTTQIVELPNLEMWARTLTAPVNPSGYENMTYNFTVMWLLNDSLSHSQVRRYQNGSNIVQAFSIGLCDVGSAVTLNISYFDLMTFLGISTTSNYVIQYYASIPANMKTAVFSFPGNYSSEFCIKPAGSTIYASIINGLINKTGYVVTSYFVTNATRTNVTENVSLYMTPLTMGQLANITIEIVDQDENALQNHIIQAWFYNAANNTYLLVDADITDINGKVRFELNTFNTMYRFLVYDQEGKLILTTITFKLLETSYRFIIPLVKYDMLQQIQNFGNFMYYNLTYNNLTGFIRSDIWDAQNMTSSVCTRVRKLEPISNNTWLLDACSLNKSAHFNLNISPYGNGTFQAMVYAYTNGSAPTPYTIGTLDVIVGLLQNIIFRSEGLLLTFFVVLLLGGIGMTGSPALLIISVLVAIGFMVISGMFVMGWGVLLGIIFAGILLVLKSRS